MVALCTERVLKNSVLPGASSLYAGTVGSDWIEIRVQKRFAGDSVNYLLHFAALKLTSAAIGEGQEGSGPGAIATKRIADTGYQDINGCFQWIRCCRFGYSAYGDHIYLYQSQQIPGAVLSVETDLTGRIRLAGFLCVCEETAR